MKKTLLFLLSLILCWSTAFAAERGIKRVEIKTTSGETVGLYAESHALVIGVSDYTAGWPDLESVPDDMKAVSQALEKQSFHVVQVLNPTKKKLTSAFTDFIDNYGYNQDNRLLFYYSGHGYTKKVYERNTGYLVPRDAPDPNQDSIGFSQKALQMSQILAWAKQIEAKHAIFLFDSCFSGSVLKERSLLVPRQIQTLTAKPVRQFISSGSAGQTVPAQSVFRPSFTRGIRGEADLDKDGYVTGTELGLYLQRQVANYDTGQTPQFGKIKDPLYDEGDFVFLPSIAAEDSLQNIAEAKKQVEAERKRIAAELARIKEEHELAESQQKLEEDRKKLAEAKTATLRQKLEAEESKQYEERMLEKKKEGSLFLREFDGEWGWYEKGDPTKNSFYVGEIKNGKPNGRGMLIFIFGDLYLGDFKDGKKHGQGTFTFHDGIKVEGEFREGNHWNTKVYDKDGNKTGTYVNGKWKKADKKKIVVLFRPLNGGRAWYEWGDEKTDRKYKGYIKNRKPNGQGTETWPDGTKHVGEWRDGLKHGQGTYTTPDGFKIVGTWKNGGMHGQIKITSHDGKKALGEMREGQFWNFTVYDKNDNIIRKWVHGLKVVEKEQERKKSDQNELEKLAALSKRQDSEVATIFSELFELKKLPLEDLKALEQTVPESSKVANKGYFTVGSTKDEVIAVQGQPDDANEDRWYYGSSRVDFQGEKVESWNNSERNLKAKIK